MVVMIEAAKRAADLGVAKMPGPVEGGDPAGESPTDSEVGGLPGDFLSEINQAGGNAGDRFLLCPLGGLDVQVYVAGQVEAFLDRCVDTANNG
jgi:hypothetical protein